MEDAIFLLKVHLIFLSYYYFTLIKVFDVCSQYKIFFGIVVEK